MLHLRRWTWHCDHCHSPPVQSEVKQSLLFVLRENRLTHSKGNDTWKFTQCCQIPHRNRNHSRIDGRVLFVALDNRPTRFNISVVLFWFLYWKSIPQQPNSKEIYLGKSNVPLLFEKPKKQMMKILKLGCVILPKKCHRSPKTYQLHWMYNIDCL